MRWELAFVLLILSAGVARADAPPKHYDITPLSQADVDFYLSIKRSGADCVIHATGADKQALDIMRQNHGVLKIPALPEIKGNPTPAQIAQLQANMTKISAQATANAQVQSRAASLATCDEAIAQKRGAKAHYDELRGIIEVAVPILGDIAASCGGDDCGPAHPSAAQLALWKTEAAVLLADRALLKPHADEIRKLQKILMSAMGL